MKISSICGTLEQAIPSLEKLTTNDKTAAAVNELKNIYSALKESPLASKIKLDLSVLNHLDYYNGVLLQGYVKNASSPVLSGGRYDNLAKKIRGNGAAFGFAVYLDGLNLYYPNKKAADCDVFITYDTADDKLLNIVTSFTEKGYTVRVENNNTDEIKANKTFYYKNGVLAEVAK